MKTSIMVLSLILLSFATAIYSYQIIGDERIASHWNAQGEIDGYMSKFWGLFLFPMLFIVLYVLFAIIPKIDPLKKNIDKFRKEYDYFVLGFFIYMFYIFVLTILANLDHKFNMTMMIVPAISLLFIGLGTFLKKVKRNWFIGIRTPWTISNDKVWEKTHALGSKMFKVLGAIMLLGIFFEDQLVLIIIIPISIVIAWLTIYSYLEYKKIKN